MLDYLAKFLLRKRYPIFVTIGVITLFLGYYSLRVRINQKPDELILQDDPEYPLLKAFSNDFGYDEFVVVAYSADNILKRENLEAIRKITEELEKIQGVERVVSLANAEDIVTSNGTLEIVPVLRELPKTEAEQETLRRMIQDNPLYKDLLISKDETTTLFDIPINGDLTNDERDRTLKHIQNIFSTYSNGNRYFLSGSPAGRAEMFRCVRRDFATLCPIAMLLLITGMYLIFRNYLCVLLPYVAVTLSVVWTIGFMYLVGSELNLLSVLIPTILFTIGTLDCIYILSQYQDCRYTCRSKAEALHETVRHMLLPCLFNSLTIMIGFGSVGVGGIGVLKSFGIFMGIGMAFAYVLAITVLPIGLSIGDTRTLTVKRPPSEALLGFLGRMYTFDARYKLPILCCGLILTLLGIYGSKKIHIETDLGKFFGSKSKVLDNILYIEKELGGGIPVYVVVSGASEDALKDPRLLSKIAELGEFLQQQDGVDKVVSASDLVKYMNFRFHESDRNYYRIPEDRKQVAELLFMGSLSDKRELLRRFFDDGFSKTVVGIRFRPRDLYSIQKLNQDIRTYLTTHFQGGSAETYVTGTAVLIANTLVPILNSLKQSLFMAIVAISIVMILVFRSLRLALISMIPNVLPILITLGVMGLLDISLNYATAPVAAIALGLATDDTIHFITKFRMEFSLHKNYSKAIQNTLLSVGKPIIVSAVVLTVGFFIFIFSNFQPTQNMGVLISFSMITGVFGDLILLPALILIFKPLGKGKPESL